jgi:hypothetical protein
MTHLNAYTQWTQSTSKKEFCMRNFITHSAMLIIQNLKEQYIRTILSNGIGVGTTLNCVVVNALGCGLFPNIVFTKQHDSIKKPILNSVSFKEGLSCHPSSCMSDKLVSRDAWYCYHEMARTETHGETY